MPAKKRSTAKDAANPTASPTPATPIDGASNAPAPTARRRAAPAEPSDVSSSGQPVKKAAAKSTAAAPKKAKTASAKATTGTAKAKASADQPTVPVRADAAAEPVAAATPTAESPARVSRAASNGMAEKPVQRPVVTEASIRQHAYFLSLRRNGSGDPVADWLEAERTLRAQSE